MRSEVFFLLLGMSLVTYLPRALPAALSEKMKFSPRVEKFLKLIPYTAMAAIFSPASSQRMRQTLPTVLRAAQRRCCLG